MPIQKLLPVGPSGPLDATRGFLRQVWDRAALDGLFIPAWADGQDDPRPALLNSPGQLERADPYAPLMVLNTAPHILALVTDNPGQHLGAVLRPCELRSLRELARRQGADLGGLLLISPDCLATFPLEDFDWRVHNAAAIEKITDEALHFAAQGGILPSRLRPTCQACELPFPADADIHIAVLGIETDRHLILGFRDAGLLGRLEFQSQPDPPADLLARRDRVLSKLTEWRQRSRAYAESHLEAEQASIQGLVRHLRGCENCRVWISKACPFFPQAWEQTASGQRMNDLQASWLLSCGGCGMCDHACPDGYPLSTVIGHLARKAAATAL
jgi:formate dehydrogenase (coenzyme F420) beta subunit